MAILTGTYQHTLDDRGRIALPARLRERLGATVFVFRGSGKCVRVVPYNVYDAATTKVTSVSWKTEQGDDDRLLEYPEVAEVDIDSQGRIAIGDDHRAEADLAGEVTIVGAGDHLQIWNKAAWAAKRAALRAAQASAAEKPESGS
jgi:MraZ protein